MTRKGNVRNDKMRCDGSDKLEQIEHKYLVSLEPREISVMSQDKKFLDEFLDLLEKNLTNPHFNIDIICNELIVSRGTLFRKIKNITGLNPNEFINSYRLERAKQLLQKNVGNVSKVAEMVGFPDQFNFSKYFKKKFGLPPKVYQNTCLKEENKKNYKTQSNESTNKDNQKKISIQVDFTLDELDREYISRVVAKSEEIFNLKDTQGDPHRDTIFKQVEMLYDPPIPLASKEALENFTLREIMQKMRKKIEKLNYKR
ncbi:MAG TPA: helix-turn-helix transcriptional regulator [Candidatus Kapabacteria bacterium]|nr:helix-turn-helix transcriptional regulator [Candidatus Kapabacteria bacterium]